MRKNGKCPHCGCTVIIERAIVDCGSVGQQQAVNLRVDANPQAIVFKGSVRSSLEADICTGCGYTEFFASDPQNLLRVAREAQKAK
jgi:predicted nucleic-acid-binding Zn-ribbon protein